MLHDGLSRLFSEAIQLVTIQWKAAALQSSCAMVGNNVFYNLSLVILVKSSLEVEKHQFHFETALNSLHKFTRKCTLGRGGNRKMKRLEDLGCFEKGVSRIG